MKKTISILTILLLAVAFIFAGNTYAAALDSINVQTDKQTIRPGQETKVTITFGEDLGAYTFDIAYDDNIFEYLSAEGGTANDTGDKVRVTYHDATGGSNPRANMSVNFKAKSDITTSNPTEFTVTGEGLSNADASVTYDDITTPIVKNVTVEPEYIDYTFKLEHTGNIIKGEETEMKLSYSSPMGHYYEHARLVAEATTPAGADVRLVGIDATTSAKQDIIESGWGDPQGYKIGGKDVLQTLNVVGTFTEVGDYAITLKLIDRDNSDHVIAQQTFNFTAVEANTNVPETNESKPETTENQEKTEEKQDKPANLPKTGNNIYVPIVLLFIVLVSTSIYYNKRK